MMVANKKKYCLSNDAASGLSLKRQHEYFYQVQMEMAITKTKYADFVVYGESGDIFVERIPHDDDFWQSCLSTLENFYLNYNVLELVTQLKRPVRLLP